MMSKGKIKEYSPERGYGTIIDYDTCRQISVYANYITLKEGEALIEGQEVEYEIELKGHESWAIDVRIA